MSYLEGQYNEVNPTSSITAENFGNSLIEFPFAVGRPNVWYPSKSYIRVSATLYSGDGTARTQPKIRDGHAFVSNPCGSIFTEILSNGRQRCVKNEFIFTSGKCSEN